MSTVNKCKTLSISIECPPEHVYEFVSDPSNLPKWATTFCRSVRRSGDEWIVETPDGAVKIAFVARNDFGVLDHRVSPAPGVEVLVPMRVVPNGSGSEILFTLCQTPDMSDEKYAEDIGWVERDLQTMKRHLEQ